MNLQQFKKGDIIFGHLRSQREAKHPIIYLYPTDIEEPNSDFVGIMLTTSNQYEDNFPLSPEYIKPADLCEGIQENHKKSFKTNKRSYLVKSPFIKPQEWGPYYKVRELTNEGIEYVEKLIEGQTPQYFEKYI